MNVALPLRSRFPARLALALTLLASSAPARAGDGPPSADPVANPDEMPRFLLPLQLDGPPGLDALPLPEHAPAAPDATPAAAPPSAAPAAAPTPAVSAAQTTVPQRNSFRPRGVWSFTDGYGLDFTPSLFFARQEARRVAESRGDLMMTARGFYHHVVAPVRDWVGTQLHVSGRLAPGFEGTAVYHHEIRDEIGDYGLASATVRLDDGLNVRGSFGAGGGAHFLPTTTLNLAFDGLIPGLPELHWSAGVGASWFQDDRYLHDLTFGVTWWVGDAEVLEISQRVLLYDARDHDARVASRTKLTLSWGVHGRLTGHVRLSGGNAPRYGTGRGSFDLPMSALFDGGFGVRGWVGGGYGLAVSISGGAQPDGFIQVGADVAVFVEL